MIEAIKRCWMPKPHIPHEGVNCERDHGHYGYHQATVDGKIVRWFR